MSLIENIEEIKKEIRTNPSNSFDIIKNNVPKYTMYQYVRECNKNNLNNFAFRFGRKRYTYGEFIELIDRYAKGFIGMGIGKGDRVALLLPNLPEFTIIIYVLNKIGAISDNIDPTSKEDRMKYFLEKEKVNAIVCFDKVYETGVKPIEEYIYNELNIDKVLITKITDSLPMIESAMYRMKYRDENIVKRVSTSYGNINIFGINRFLNDSRYQVCYTNPYVENEVATICHSSGTTGVPKTIPFRIITHSGMRRRMTYRIRYRMRRSSVIPASLMIREIQTISGIQMIRRTPMIPEIRIAQMAKGIKIHQETATIRMRRTILRSRH